MNPYQQNQGNNYQPQQGYSNYPPQQQSYQQQQQQQQFQQVIISLTFRYTPQ